jgi:hypothetical protein
LAYGTTVPTPRPQAFRGGVGSIGADHDGWALFVGLASPDGVEIHQSHVPATRQVHPSVAAASHISLA